MCAHDSESRATLRQKTDSRSESCKRNGSLVRLQVPAALEQPDSTAPGQFGTGRAGRSCDTQLRAQIGRVRTNPSLKELPMCAHDSESRATLRQKTDSHDG